MVVFDEELTELFFETTLPFTFDKTFDVPVTTRWRERITDRPLGTETRESTGTGRSYVLVVRELRG